MKTKTATTALLIAAGLFCTLPALADPPSWAPAHGRRAHEAAAQHRYVYYRNEVPMYYAPQRGLWFWLSGGNWQFGARLPAQYQQYATGGISIQLETERPYERNAYVEQHYGAPRHDVRYERRVRGDRHGRDDRRDRDDHHGHDEHGDHEHGHH